jgi:hypothetical protein
MLVEALTELVPLITSLIARYKQGTPFDVLKELIQTNTRRSKQSYVR